MGVDPGVHGGAAVLRQDGLVLGIQAFAPGMPRREVWEAVGALADSVKRCDPFGDHHAFLERVGYIRGDGGQGAFTFGRVVGMLEIAAHGHGLRISEVMPAVWQSRLDCLSRGDKRVTKRRAQVLFPRLAPTITHATADALLIAEYGRRRLAQ